LRSPRAFPDRKKEESMAVVQALQKPTYSIFSTLNHMFDKLDVQQREKLQMSITVNSIS